MLENNHTNSFQVSYICRYTHIYIYIYIYAVFKSGIAIVTDLLQTSSCFILKGHILSPFNATTGFTFHAHIQHLLISF